MPAPYFQLLGHVFTAVHTCRNDKDVASVLVDAGFGQERLKQGVELAELGVSLPDRRVDEVGDLRIIEHGVHTSATELEMWMQTAEFKLKQELNSPGLLEVAAGSDLHCEEHVVEVVARALRMLGVLRTHPVLHDKLGTGRSTRDLLIRGNTLLSKLYDAGQDLMTPGSSVAPDAEVFDVIETFEVKATRWLQDLEEVAESMDDQAAVLGKLGFVPEDVGLPVGGTGYSITLHERSHREPPDPDEEVRPDPSWTIGRQGQNNENMGKGWVEPSFD